MKWLFDNHKKGSEHKEQGSLESIVAKVYGIFDMHMRRGAHERYFCGKDAREAYPKDIVNVIKNGLVTDHTLLPELWISIFMKIIERPEKHPLLVAEPLFGYSDQQKQSILKAAFNALLVPSVTFVNSAVLALLYHKETNGIVVSVGHSVGCVVAVINGKVWGEPQSFNLSNLLDVNVAQFIWSFLSNELCNCNV